MRMYIDIHGLSALQTLKAPLTRMFPLQGENIYLLLRSLARKYMGRLCAIDTF